MNETKAIAAVETIRTTLSKLTDDERALILDELLPRAAAHNAISLQYEEIRAALEKHNGDIAATARELGCARRTLQTKMRRLGFPPGRSGRKVKVK